MIISIQIYQICKTLIHSELLELFNHNILIPELLTLEEIKNGTQLSVEAPQRTGLHDDISDSFVIAVYLAYDNFQNKQSNYITSGFSNRNGNNGKILSYKYYQYQKIKQHGFNPKRGLEL